MPAGTLYLLPTTIPVRGRFHAGTIHNRQSINNSRTRRKLTRHTYTRGTASPRVSHKYFPHWRANERESIPQSSVSTSSSFPSFTLFLISPHVLDGRGSCRTQLAAAVQSRIWGRLLELRQLTPPGTTSGERGDREQGRGANPHIEDRGRSDKNEIKCFTTTCGESTTTFTGRALELHLHSSTFLLQPT